MTTAAPPGTHHTKPESSFGGILKFVAIVLLSLLLVLVVLEALTLRAEQLTELQRRSIAIAGGRTATKRVVPDWLQQIAGPEFHTFFDQTRLVKVEFAGDKVSEAKLVEILQSLRGVVDLDLQYSPMTDLGLNAVVHLKTLTALNIRNTKTSNLALLSSLPNLSSLNIAFTEVREKELEAISKFPKLRGLNAGGPVVNDDGIKMIAKCQHLEQLNLTAVTLGESGLQPLQTLKQLKLLTLMYAKVNPADVAAFKQAVPDCKVME